MRSVIVLRRNDVATEMRTRAVVAAAARIGAQIIEADDDVAPAQLDAECAIFVDDAMPAPDAFERIVAAFEDEGVVLAGGRAVVADEHRFGAMIAPARFGPLPFEFAPVVLGEANAAAASILRGDVDLLAPGVIAATRDGLRLAPEGAPWDDVVLAVWSARVRAAGGRVVCEPSAHAALVPGNRPAARTRYGRLIDAAPEIAARPPSHRLPDGLRRVAIDRLTRVPGGYTAHRTAMPPVDAVVYGDGDAARAIASLRAGTVAPRSVTVAGPRPLAAHDVKAVEPATALPRATARRGDRYVVLLEAGAVVAERDVEALVHALEESPGVAVSRSGAATLVALRHVPAHVMPPEGEPGAALAAWLEAIRECGLHRRDPDGTVVVGVDAPAELPRATIIALCTSLPQVAHQAIGPVQDQATNEDRVVLVVPAGYAMLKKVLAQFRNPVVEDDVDPALTVALNRILATVETPLVVVTWDDHVWMEGTLDALKTAFARDRRLGVAAPCSNVSDGAEAISGLAYRDLTELKSVAARRARDHRGETRTTEVLGVPVLAFSRNVLDVVGGFDERLGARRIGAHDFSIRARAAGYRACVVLDGFAHAMEGEQTGSTGAKIDADPEPVARLGRRWSLVADARGLDVRGVIARGFDPALAVPLRAAAEERPTATPALDALVAIRDASELRAALPSLVAFFQAFRAGDAVELVLIADGEIEPSDVALALRSAVIDAGADLTAIPDVSVLRGDAETVLAERSRSNIVLAGGDRPALTGLPRAGKSSAQLRRALERAMVTT